MTVATELEIVDLRHFSALQLRPLLETEARVWQQRLRWNYQSSTELLLQYLDSRILPGFVALDHGRICGFSFCVYEGHKAVIGDAYAIAPGNDPAQALHITQTLLHHLLQLLLHSPTIDRVESQLLLYEAGTIEPSFLQAGFTMYPRLFMEYNFPPDLGAAPTTTLSAAPPSYLTAAPATPATPVIPTALDSAPAPPAAPATLIAPATLVTPVTRTAPPVSVGAAAPAATSAPPLPRLTLPSNIALSGWTSNLYQAAAELIHESYTGHIDARINDQYCSLHGSLRFLHNIVRFPGCGVFEAEQSWVLREKTRGALVGIVLCSRVAEDVAHITQLCIAPSYRGAALGRILLRHCISQLPQSGFKAITLTVTEANRQAVKLYEDLGFFTRHRFDAMVLDKT
ncbi:MAG TPA: GNAT family N-acetyltransferase [Edaphobacter sp.]|nr:GNAT family N-acetyltransferase [Edaphobacter sp.]